MLFTILLSSNLNWITLLRSLQFFQTRTVHRCTAQATN